MCSIVYLHTQGKVYMKAVNLLTFRNHYFAEELSRTGFHIINYPRPLPSEAMEALKVLRRAPFSVVEVVEADRDTAELLKFMSTRGHVIAVAEEETAEIRSLLLECGVSDLLTGENVPLLPAFLRLLEEGIEEIHGQILILDESAARRRMIHRIISRFGMDVFFYESVDEMLGAAEGETQLMLIHLPEDDFETQKIITSCLRHEVYGMVPIVAYSDMKNGFSFHGFAAGLQRLTRVLLTPEELYRFLLDMLFRKAMAPAVNGIYGNMEPDSLHLFRSDSLRQIIFTARNSIFTMENLMERNVTTGLMDNLNVMRAHLTRSEGLRWLSQSGATEEVSVSVSCG